MDNYFEYEKLIKKNWKRAVHWTIMDNGYITQLVVSKVPMPIYHVVRHTAIFFDKLANKTRRFAQSLTYTEINFEDNFKMVIPKEKKL